jgi:hypothetical protein
LYHTRVDFFGGAIHWLTFLLAFFGAICHNMLGPVKRADSVCSSISYSTFWYAAWFGCCQVRMLSAANLLVLFVTRAFLSTLLFFLIGILVSMVQFAA